MDGVQVAPMMKKETSPQNKVTKNDKYYKLKTQTCSIGLNFAKNANTEPGKKK